MRSLLILTALILIGLLAIPAVVTACGCGPGYYDPPTEPRDLHVDINSESLRVEWTEPEYTGAGSVMYVLFRGLTEEEMESVDDEITSEFYIDTDVEVGVEYYYSVAAYNYGGGSGLSETVSHMLVTIPSEPRNLSADCGKGYINLQWELPFDTGMDPFLEYNVFMAEQYEELELVAEGINDTSFNCTGLDNHLTYKFEVSAVSDAGESVSSPTFMASPMHLPGEPVNIRSKTGWGWVHLEWDRPEDTGGEPELRYDIYKSLAGQPKAVAKSGQPVTNYNCTGLIEGAEYIFRIKSVNLLGESVFSEAHRIRAVGPPSTPQDISHEYGSHHVTLRWAAPADETVDKDYTYNIYMSEGAAEFRSIATGVEDNEYTVEPLENGKQHYFKICAVNSYGEGEHSPLIQAIPMGLPTAVVNLEAEPRYQNVDLSWEEPITDGGGDVRYVVRMYSSEDPEAPCAEYTVAQTRLNVVCTGSSMFYTFTVSALNAQGEGPASNVTSATLPFTPSGAGPEPESEPDEPKDPRAQTPAAAEQPPPVKYTPWDHNLIPATIVAAPAAVLAIGVMLFLIDRQKRKKNEAP